MDDSYHADFLLTYRTFLTSPGEIFDKLLTSWNERAEVHDQVMMYFVLRSLRFMTRLLLVRITSCLNKH